MTDPQTKDTRDGVIAGLIAYSIWGVLPVYFKIVASVAPLEVLLHRVVWAIPFGALIIHLRKQWPEVRRALTHRGMLFWLATSAFFIAVNWFVYIVAVQKNQVFQASLGYYINPLAYVLVGVLFLGERLRPLQIGAVILAAIGVSVLTFSGGKLPAIALTLAFSFTVYGVIRKKVVIGGMPGLFVETVILAPLALAGLIWLELTGSATFGSGDVAIDTLLMTAGPLTVVPLLCFALAARRLTLTSIGFMQFIAPTLQFCVGVWYGEVLTGPHLICFSCIWTAVILFSADALRRNRRRAIVPAG
ncbi:MAG: EamA family transporter RarD [Woeseiaceae bacterium]